MKAQIAKWCGDYQPPFSKWFYKEVVKQDWELRFPKCLIMVSGVLLLFRAKVVLLGMNQDLMLIIQRLRKL